MASNGSAENTVTYEELIQLEYDFNDAEDEIGILTLSIICMDQKLTCW
jgi:hypothetical protein